MTSGRPAAAARNVTGGVAVASFVGLVAAFQIGANAGPYGALSTSHGALVTPTSTPISSAVPTVVPTATPVTSPKKTTTVIHSTKHAPVHVVAPRRPAPAKPPVAKTKPSGGG